MFFFLINPSLLQYLYYISTRHNIKVIAFWNFRSEKDQRQDHIFKPLSYIFQGWQFKINILAQAFLSAYLTCLSLQLSDHLKTQSKLLLSSNKHPSFLLLDLEDYELSQKLATKYKICKFPGILWWENWIVLLPCPDNTK